MGPQSEQDRAISQIPEEGMGGPSGAPNPIIDALKELGQFAIAQRDQGNPMVAEALIGLLQAMNQAPGGEQPAQQPQAPQQAAQAPAPEQATATPIV
jgi:hypothetical protein